MTSIVVSVAPSKSGKHLKSPSPIRSTTVSIVEFIADVIPAALLSITKSANLSKPAV